MSKETLGIIDVGTNTVLALVCRRDKSRLVDIMLDVQEVVRLGQDVDKTKKFHPDALERLRKTLKNFKRHFSDLGVQKQIAVATSAARDAKNKESLVEIFEELKIPLRIISGKLEAEMTFLGAFDKEIDRTLAVIDVGGGSTELTVGDHLGIEVSHSFDVGAVRLTERFFPGGEITPRSFDEAKAFVQEFFEPVVHLDLNVQSIISVAGTPTSYAAMDLGQEFDPKKIHGYQLTQEELYSWIEKLSQLPLSQRKKVSGLDEKRADVIVAGGLILWSLIKELGCDRTSVSIKGLRYGVAKHFERVEAYKRV